MQFSSIMINDESFIDATQVEMSLAYTNDLQKHVNFEIKKGAVGASEELMSTCGALEEKGHYCRLPFNWKTDHWYTLKLDLFDTDVWRASVFDHTTEQTTVVGKIEVVPELEWHQSRITLSYSADIDDIADCNESLPRIAMQAKSANANGVVNVKPSSITVSKCVDSGVGWRAGTKTRNSINTYTLSIGDGR